MKINKEDREKCIRKNFLKRRELERIPVICELIKEFWKQYNLKMNENINMYKIFVEIKTKELEEGRITNNDSFYWEEDRWFDFFFEKIDENIIEYCNVDLAPDVLKDIEDSVNAFEQLWEKYVDLRFNQILNVFFEIVYKEIGGYNAEHWKDILEGGKI